MKMFRSGIGVGEGGEEITLYDGVEASEIDVFLEDATGWEVGRYGCGCGCGEH